MQLLGELLFASRAATVSVAHSVQCRLCQLKHPGLMCWLVIEFHSYLTGGGRLKLSKHLKPVLCDCITCVASDVRLPALGRWYLSRAWPLYNYAKETLITPCKPVPARHGGLLQVQCMGSATVLTSQALSSLAYAPAGEPGRLPPGAADGRPAGSAATAVHRSHVSRWSSAGAAAGAGGHAGGPAGAGGAR